MFRLRGVIELCVPTGWLRIGSVNDFDVFERAINQSSETNGAHSS